MRTDIFIACVATAIPKKTCHRISAAWHQLGTKNVDLFLFYYWHS